MIENILSKIIEELGATGVLVVGLYFLLYKPIKNISVSIKTINHNSSKLVDIFENQHGGKNK